MVQHEYAINKITKEKVFPKYGNKTDEYICPFTSCKLIWCYGGGKKKSYFRTLPENEENVENEEEKIKEEEYVVEKIEKSKIHKDAQLKFKSILEKGCDLEIYRKCIACETFGVFFIKIPKNSKIECEHSFKFNDKIYRADLAFIENENIKYIFEIFNTNETNENDRPEPWCEFDAKSIMELEENEFVLTCIRRILCKDCVQLGKKKCQLCGECCPLNKCKNKEVAPGKIYFNQRGAGCGKTYESIQLMDKYNIYPEFKYKDTFIYLTKMNSAKHVILNELIDQDKGKKFENIKIIDSSQYENQPTRQYVKTLENTFTKQKINVVIGTIDSFNYAVVDNMKVIEKKDYFKGIVKTIIYGDVCINKNGSIKYARNTYNLDNNCLIIIDESQDLDKDYIEAFRTIILKTNIDVYVIGDKLQSIWFEHNIHTFIDKYNFDNVEIIRSKGKNQVARFHNTQFINMVNTVIDFKTYNLLEIDGICNRDNCGFIHENDKQPFTIFESPIFYSNDWDHDKIYGFIDQIIEYMEHEIQFNNYLPHNFLFIFPLVSKNAFASALETRLQIFWMKKFADTNYKNNVFLFNKHYNKYWKCENVPNEQHIKEYVKYVYLHKSEENKPINLAESEYATRILSIHASKGNGCEVVFLLGISEDILTLFSKKKNNLVYESLLHVAITRQKKHIYVGLENNCDDIWNRFRKLGEIIKDENNIPNIKNIHQRCSLHSISKNIYNQQVDDSFLNKVMEQIKKKEIKTQFLLDEEKSKQVIDWGHHLLIVFYLIFIMINNNIIVEKNKF